MDNVYVKPTKIDKIKKQQDDLIKSEALKKLRLKIENDVDYTLDGSVKQLFLNLTKKQIPFNYEDTLAEFFPKNMSIDDFGNYHIRVGETSGNMFCGHLDTYCYQNNRVWHTIDGNIIGTDKTTTLGGDDKAGIVIMINMINAGVPGLYYFFRGEEGVTSPNGTWGSKKALAEYKDVFSSYSRCIAFDRRGTDSIITKQSYSVCCSDDFTNALIKQFADNGLTYRNDPTGMWCDSGVFMETIPECTNISVGYFNEHTFNETQNIEHLEKLVAACIKIDWDKLPVKRDPTEIEISYSNYHANNYNWKTKYDDNYITNWKKNNTSNTPLYTKSGDREYSTCYGMFQHVIDILDEISYDCLNPTSFGEAEEMYFQNTKTNDFFGLKIIDYDVFISDDDSLKIYSFIGDLETFENYISLSDTKKSEDTLSIKKDNRFTDIQNLTFNLFCSNNSDLVKLIIESKEYSKTFKNINGILSDDWDYIHDKMIKNKITITYITNGINPDEFIDWFIFNWDFIKKTYYDKTNNTEDEQIDAFKKLVASNNALTLKVFNIYKDNPKNIDNNEYNKLWMQVEEQLQILKIKTDWKNTPYAINATNYFNWFKKNMDLIEGTYIKNNKDDNKLSNLYSNKMNTFATKYSSLTKLLLSEMEKSNANVDYITKKHIFQISESLYEYHILDITPIKYVMWVFDNRTWLARYYGVSSSTKKNNITKLFTTEQLNLFNEVVEIKSKNIKFFIKQVIDKGIIDDDINYEQYKQTVESWIIEAGFYDELKHKKEDINYIAFLDWLKENKYKIIKFLDSYIGD